MEYDQNNPIYVRTFAYLETVAILAAEKISRKANVARLQREAGKKRT